MSILEAIVLGVVQGITEFLPISSSGHLIVIPELFSWQPGGLLFDVGVHIGTLLAIIFALWSDVLGIFKSKKLFVNIVIATIPVVLAGLFIPGEFFDALRTPAVVAVSLVVWGIFLIFADKIGKKTRRLNDLTLWEALLIGLFQIIALIPGTSRSGITISAGLIAGADREAAAKFSFLIAIPAIAGAGLLTGLDAWQAGQLSQIDLSFLAGFLAAFTSGILAIKLLLNLVKKISYAWFGIYRIALAAMILLLI